MANNGFGNYSNGATGAYTDRSMASLLLSNGIYLAFRFDFSLDYEYYFSYNLKTGDPAGMQVQFFHNPSPESEGTPIGNPVMAPFIPVDQPGQDFDSAIFGELGKQEKIQ